MLLIPGGKAAASPAVAKAGSSSQPIEVGDDEAVDEDALQQMAGRSLCFW